MEVWGLPMTLVKTNGTPRADCPPDQGSSGASVARVPPLYSQGRSWCPVLAGRQYVLWGGGSPGLRPWFSAAEGAWLGGAPFTSLTLSMPRQPVTTAAIAVVALRRGESSKHAVKRVLPLVRRVLSGQREAAGCWRALPIRGPTPPGLCEDSDLSAAPACPNDPVDAALSTLLTMREGACCAAG
jgi:hypothetical protein